MPPPVSTHPKKVQALIHRLNAPLKVQHWIHSLSYNKEKTMRSLHGVIKTNRAHCLEAAMSAAVILEHHGYTPLILDLESKDYLDHTLFLFRKNGKYGAVGMSRDVGLYGRKPVYSTIEALAKSYAAPYIDEKACLKAFGVLDLRTLKNSSWRTSESNVWHVEEALRNIPHKKLQLSPAFVQRWRKKYIAFKKLHPGQQPDYFPHQENWM